LHDNAEGAKALEMQLTRRIKVLESDTIQERILVDKMRIEEVDETIRVQRAGETRNALQKELEEVEHKDTMVKFELYELQRVHEELVKSLDSMKKHNNQLVEPVLDRLRKEVCALWRCSVWTLAFLSFYVHTFRLQT
jgi:FtsZ-binding cell division protein ZapB